jgi:hypothetical protein
MRKVLFSLRDISALCMVMTFGQSIKILSK